jgi:hypothetical protein
MGAEDDRKICEYCDEILAYLDKEVSSVLITEVWDKFRVPSMLENDIISLLEKNGHIKKSWNDYIEISPEGSEFIKRSSYVEERQNEIYQQRKIERIKKHGEYDVRRSNRLKLMYLIIYLIIFLVFLLIKNRSNSN